jgi:hypothetical protein
MYKYISWIEIYMFLFKDLPDELPNILARNWKWDWNRDSICIQYPPQVLAHPLPILVFQPARDRPYDVSHGNFFKILILIVEPSSFFHQKDKELFFIFLIFIWKTIHSLMR